MQREVSEGVAKNRERKFFAELRVVLTLALAEKHK